MKLKVHSFIESSLGNGPGRRCVLWLQGCSLNCPGCFNTDTHDFAGGEHIAVADVLSQIEAAHERYEIEGVTVSGGEPLQQPEEIACLLELLREKTDLSVVLFTGFTYQELSTMPVFERLTRCVDVLICGRYVESMRVAAGLTGSANKSFHYFSERYRQSDFDDVAVGEVIIDEKGRLVLTGIDPLRLR